MAVETGVRDTTSWMRRVGAVLACISLAACASGTSPAGVEDIPTIGILRVVPDDDHVALLSELRQQGWIPGRDVKLVPNSATRVYEDARQAREAVTAWVRDGVDLILAFSTPYAHLADEVAPETPVLFMVNDPEAAGLVTHPRRPRGHLSGVTFRTPADRTLRLASEFLPEDVSQGGVRFGYMGPADDPAVPGHLAAMSEAAEAQGFELVESFFAGPEDVPSAVGELVAAKVDVVVLASSATTVQAADVLESELTRHRLPAVANTDFLEFAVLIVTPDGAELRRQLARQTARILSGANLSGVPVEDPRKFLVIVNRTQARDLGLPEVDQDILRLADLVR